MSKEMLKVAHDLFLTTSVCYWVQYNKIIVEGRRFDLLSHPYQAEILDNTARVSVFCKGAQIGFTTVALLQTLHGLIYGRYPSGVLYLFPTDRDVSDFSRVRLGAFVKQNECLAGVIRDTDSVELKAIGRSVLYLRGARSRSRLKSIPVDRIVFDELDEMDPPMVELAKQRIAHSKIKEEVYLSTPTIPDYGIHALYQQSSQHVWMIKCEACGGETCLELEFPNCVTEKGDRLCKHCGRKINWKNGRWVAQHPDAEIRGYWISQLCSDYVSPGVILREFYDPPGGRLNEVYNSRLGMPYIDIKDRLTEQQVFECCGRDPQQLRWTAPTAMGVDVGNVLHIVIGYAMGDNSYRILRLHRTTEWNDIHDLAVAFNVNIAVIDMRPEVRKVRELQDQESFPIYGCVYHSFRLGRPTWDEEKGIVTVGRTEWMDAVHNAIAENMILLPRRDSEVELYAKHMSSVCKTYEEDSTGDIRGIYKRVSDDHYYHATGYMMLACQRLPVGLQPTFVRAKLRPKVNLV
ncbi:MAG: phage terminase large subunit family protein [Candidatus Caldarchaeum sp.]